MNSRQVGVVLGVLIAIAVAGLVVRVVTSEPQEVVLSGLLPLSQDVVTKVKISTPQDGLEATLERRGEGASWTVQNQPAFQPKLDAFWQAVSDIESSAQLIAMNPNNHERMGVSDDSATVVSFLLGDFEQEKLLIGTWSPQVGLCYVRRSGNDEVYGVPCPSPITAMDIFDPRPDGWLDPVILNIPRSEIETLTFEYPGDQFDLTFTGADWVVGDEAGEVPADLARVDSVLRVIELLFAEGFATAEESEGLRFDNPTASVRVVTRSGASNPTTRIRVLERDDLSYYVKTPIRSTVFIVNRNLLDLLRLTREELSSEDAG